MKKHKIIVITKWGGCWGYGHIQRMTNLVSYLNDKNYPAFLCSDNQESPICAEINPYHIHTIPDDCSMIIHDMRDSTLNYMKSLISKYRVATIDDNGPGSVYAHQCIDVLPNPKPASTINRIPFSFSHFIYGYTFTQSLFSIQIQHINIVFDIALYLGYSFSNEIIRTVLSCIPPRYSVLILGGNCVEIYKNNQFERLDIPYALALLSSRILITHFGISLFEGKLCNCKLCTINPTPYHEKLTQYIEKDHFIQRLGLLNQINREFIHEQINTMLASSESKKVDINEIKSCIEYGMDRFIQYIIAH